MRGRSKAGPTKTRRRKPAAPKRPGWSEAARPRKSSAAGQESEVARLGRELAEARQEQTATSEVLRIISSSPSDLKPVFQAILDKAVRICEAKFGHLVLADGDFFRLAAEAHTPAALAQHLKYQFEPTPDSHLDRVRRTKQVSFTKDDAAEPVLGRAARYGGARSMIAVPMLHDQQLVGVILIFRQEVRPFTDEQIELVQNFAAQAVIAIENARLLNELRGSLDRQTATSEVLGVISKSPGDLEPIYQAILENATRICEAKFGVLNLHENGALRMGAMHNVPTTFAEWLKGRRGAYKPIEGSLPDRVMRTKQVSYTADNAAEANPGRAATLGGARSTVTVPMLKDEELVGTITIYRQEVRPFTDKQIELLQNFAAQAVIAIENTRLLNELRESLEQQTATAEVLRIISSSPSELEPVFQAMLENATRLCEAKFGTLFLYDGNTFRVAAGVGTPPELAEFEKLRGPFQPELGGRLERMVGTKQVIHIIDDAAEDVPSPPTRFAGARSIVAVPMLKEDVLIGAISIYRQEVRAFADKQIALLVNFAAQAVIAIENARLLNELRESLQQQTAAAEVLKVISSSPDDLTPVFEAILANAVKICGAKFGNLFLCDGDKFTIVAMHGAPPPLAEWWRRNPTIRPGPQTGLAHLAQTKQFNQTEDLKAGAAYAERDPLRVATVELAGARTLVDIPLLKDDALVGAIVIYRQEVRLFADKEIELLTGFAAQAVIAIENARLLNELRQRTEQLQLRSQEIAKLNQQLEQRVADQVGEIERMSRLRRFLPPQVADLIVASGTEKQLESHRREITALFCDLRGFTGFSESSDPEDEAGLPD